MTDQPDFSKLTAQLAAMQEQMNQMMDMVTKPAQKTQERSEPLSADSRLIEMQSQIDKVLSENKRIDSANKREALKNQARDLLSKQGVDGERLPHAMKWIEDRLVYDNQGNPRYKNQDGIMEKLADGISQFAQSDEGKFYRDAKLVAGAGSTSQPQGNQMPGQRTQFKTDLSTEKPKAGKLWTDKEFDNALARSMGMYGIGTN